MFRVALKFRDNPVLLTKVTQIRKVLELMSDREFKNRYDVNEVWRELSLDNEIYSGGCRL